MKNIDYVIYLMLENRSLDSVLGWLYEKDTPAQFVPSPRTKEELVYQGLQTGNYTNPASSGKIIPVNKIPKGKTQVPDADPHEPYEHVNVQLFGAADNPPKGKIPPMNGFVKDFEDVSNNLSQIMANYTPESLPVINFLAKQFAVSDAYFSSIPTQTNCNRAMSLTGNSIGYIHWYDDVIGAMVDNWWDGPMPYEFTENTIWNVLAENGHSSTEDWMVYYSQKWPVDSMGNYCYTQDLLWPKMSGYSDHFKHIGSFFEQLMAGSLPKFSYLEPQWFEEEYGIGHNGNDYHPPANVAPGEHLLFTLVSLLMRSPHWDNTLLIINFDEHGGTYDHVAPPWGVFPPWYNSADGTKEPAYKEKDFGFDRLGVRVPLLLISPRIPAKTVFRSQTTVPLDHTSVIATILEHFKIPRPQWQLGSRVANAASFGELVSLDTPRKNIPPLPLPPQVAASRYSGQPNDLQRMIAHKFLVRLAKLNQVSVEDFKSAHERHFSQVRTLRQMNKAIKRMAKEMGK